MECVQPDLSGDGVSLIADVNDIIASLSHQESVLATLRERPAPFKRDTSSGGEVFYAPVLSPSTWQQNRENVRFLISDPKSHSALDKSNLSRAGRLPAQPKEKQSALLNASSANGKERQRSLRHSLEIYALQSLRTT